MKAYVALTTDRLILRSPEEDDFEEVARYMASPRAAFTGGVVTDRFEQWRGFLTSIGHWGLRGYGMFTVVQKERYGGRIVGRVGLINHLMWDEPELGWHLFDGFEGQGYATEAAREARLWAWEAHGFNRLISYIHPDNEPSQGVARRLGATVERSTTLLGKPAQVWRHPEARG